MSDRERETREAAAAIARLIRANPSADVDDLARECVSILELRGWRHVIRPAPGWAHHGGGLPSPDSDGGRALAEVRARFEARSGHG
jgi:hypothetical protein